MSESVSTAGGGASNRRRRLATTVATVLTVLTGLAACATPVTPRSGHEMPSGMADMPGMADMSMANAPTEPAVADAEPGGTGLFATAGGYSLAAGMTAPDTVTFRINGSDGKAVTRYQPYESRLVVLYVIRSDLSGYRLLDPAMREDGTWAARLPALSAGSYRAFVTFAAPDSSQGTPLRHTLSRPFTVEGQAEDAPLPSAATTTTVDGFAVGWTGQPRAGVSSPVGVSIARGGKKVDNVDRFLDGYAHLTAFRVGDLALTRAFSTGKDSAGLLTANAMFPGSGTWRLFAQFQVDGQQHTAAFTVVVPAGR
ncbi:hypothetical protein F0L68_36515 [Solihabitans fulvus]|uniref:Uncharacterized protein n=1 Tax=Solihabitans fulvus TaxID=1892852 RepID=A0A5B2WNK2_9PSEU|nr:hypothetical protein [Solihabitans fulvus]KAA2252242.1 hypothetical protein F0L68_36515 [Solihabitans fulvus]